MISSLLLLLGSTMRRAVFLCRQCGEELSDFLTEADESSLQFRVGENAVAKGMYIQLSSPWSYQDFVRMKQAPRHIPLREGDVIAFDMGDCLVHVDDVRYKIKANARHGCCGWQPQNEANAQCSNKHDIGTIHSDECWSSIVFRIDRKSVDIVVVED